MKQKFQIIKKYLTKFVCCLLISAVITCTSVYESPKILITEAAVETLATYGIMELIFAILAAAGVTVVGGVAIDELRNTDLNVSLDNFFSDVGDNLYKFNEQAFEESYNTLVVQSYLASYLQMACNGNGDSGDEDPEDPEEPEPDKTKELLKKALRFLQIGTAGLYLDQEFNQYLAEINNGAKASIGSYAEYGLTVQMLNNELFMQRFNEKFYDEDNHDFFGFYGETTANNVKQSAVGYICNYDYEGGFYNPNGYTSTYSDIKKFLVHYDDENMGVIIMNTSKVHVTIDNSKNGNYGSALKSVNADNFKENVYYGVCTDSHIYHQDKITPIDLSRYYGFDYYITSDIGYLEDNETALINYCFDIYTNVVEVPQYVNLLRARAIASPTGFITNPDAIEMPIIPNGSVVTIPKVAEIQQLTDDISIAETQPEVGTRVQTALDTLIQPQTQVDPDTGAEPVPNPNPSPEVNTTAPPDPDSSAAPDDDDDVDNYLTPGLKDVFPFCIPWDIYSLFKNFTSGRSAPVIEFNLKSNRFGFNHTVRIDLSVFDEVATICRTLELALYIMALAVGTRKLIGAE